MADIQNIQAAFAEKARATLAPFGIALENPCDLAQLKETITRLTEDFLKEARESIQALTADGISAQFFPIVAQIMVELFGMAEGMAAAYVDKIVGELISKGMGVLYSVVALVLTSLEGINLVLSYLSVSALKRTLEKRIEMNRVIEIDIRILIGFVKNLKRVIDVKKAKAGQVGALVLAKSRLNTVLQILATETSKIKNRTNYALSKSAIDSAVIGIKEAINDLTQNVSGPSEKLINKAARNASDKLRQKNPGNMTQELLEVVNASDLVKIINKNIKDIIFEDVSQKNASARDYDSALKAQMRVFDLYLSEVFPLVPDALQLVLAQELVGSSVNRLVKRVPLLGGLSAEATKKATELLAKPAKELQKHFPITPSILNEPPILKQEPKLTWKRAMTAGKMAKSAVILLPEYLGFLRSISYMADLYLDPARAKVREVHGDIQDTIDDIKEKRVDLMTTQIRKAKWISSLLTAKGMLKGLTPTITFESGKQIDVASSLEQQRIADSYLSKIKLKIQEYSYDPASGEANLEPGDVVFTLAQTYLMPLVASQAVLFNPSTLSRMTPGLMSIKTLLAQQHSQDLEILTLCNYYLSIMEGLPTFQVAKAVFDEAFGSIASPVDDILKQIKNGDLSGIVNTLDVTNVLNEVSNMALCFGKDVNFKGVNSLLSGEWDALALTWGSAKKFHEWEKDKDKMLNDLKDKLADLTDITAVADIITSQITQEISKIKDFTGVG